MRSSDDDEKRSKRNPSIKDDDDDDKHRSNERKRKQRTNDNPDVDRNRKSRNQNRSGGSHRKHRKQSRRRDRNRSDSSSSSSEDRRKKHRKTRKRKRRHSSSSSDGTSDSDVDAPKRNTKKHTKRVIPNRKLLEQLSARGETLEERSERRLKRRQALLASKFGYTPDENPFHDPHLHEPFSWKKKEQQQQQQQPGGAAPPIKKKNDAKQTFDEIEKVRERRKQREMELSEREKQRAEESRQREMENYDEWAKKEELFHLHQQRQRSAIRLVEGRETPVDVLAKNLLLFGLKEDETDGTKVKYREKYNALEELGNLEAELEEPYELVRHLTVEELEELEKDVTHFVELEKQAVGAADPTKEDDDTVLKYWMALKVVARDELDKLKSGGEHARHAQSVINDIQTLFEGKSQEALRGMKMEIVKKLSGSSRNDDTVAIDTDYWKTVLNQLIVHQAKAELSDIHSRMLVQQLDKLEQRKQQLATASTAREKDDDDDEETPNRPDTANQPTTTTSEPSNARPNDLNPDLSNLEEELGLTSEVNLGASTYTWQDKYRPRKPRYFNRVKTGYDWNKYNQTHYDHDNPPPKIVQGYKFNIFYPDLIDKTQTPGFVVEPTDSPEFCILRFRAGPPYEDIAFKIINREWNKSRKRGFRSTFERGVLSLYFNFNTHWYRR